MEKQAKTARTQQMTWMPGALAFMLNSVLNNNAFTGGFSTQEEGFRAVLKDCLGDGGAAFFYGQEDIITAKKLLDKTRAELNAFKMKRLNPSSNRSDLNGEFTIVEDLLNKISMVRYFPSFVSFFF